MPVAAFCAESVSDSPGGRDATGTASPNGKKAGKKVKKRKKPDMNNPEKLQEIAEKTIRAIQSPEGDSGSNLNLPVKGRISSTVGLRPDPVNGDIRMHNGIDIAISEGTQVKPVASGRVAYSGMQPGTAIWSSFSMRTE
jgi:murein DD-endopeptidase MepM/ murein hydrolase activator NlpD